LFAIWTTSVGSSVMYLRGSCHLYVRRANMRFCRVFCTDVCAVERSSATVTSMSSTDIDGVL
jgi:hypothetical protein